jgi:hypothetical protein
MFFRFGDQKYRHPVHVLDFSCMDRDEDEVTVSNATMRPTTLHFTAVPRSDARDGISQASLSGPPHLTCKQWLTSPVCQTHAASPCVADLGGLSKTLT